MKLIPYKEILAMAKEKVQEAFAPMRAREMRKKAELEQLQLESKLMEHDQKIQEICAAYPIDFKKLLDQLDEKALIERRIKQYKKIIDEMFPED